MTAPPWFRFYSETLTDRKIDRICRATGQPKMNIIGAWTILLALANDSPVRGVLLLTEDIPFTLGDLAGEMGIERDTAEAIVNEFRKFDMIHDDEHGTLYITHWNGRQFASDSSTERVQRYRAKKQALPDTDGNEDETLQERDGNLPEQSRAESDTEQSRDRTDTYAGKPAVANAKGYQEIRAYWLSRFPDKPKPRADNRSLQGKAKTRLKDGYFRDNWQAALERAAQSTFLGDGGFFDLGWFLKNDDNWQKCLNGNYDDPAGGGKADGANGVLKVSGL